MSIKSPSSSIDPRIHLELSTKVSEYQFDMVGDTVSTPKSVSIAGSEHLGRLLYATTLCSVETGL